MEVESGAGLDDMMPPVWVGGGSRSCWIEEWVSVSNNITILLPPSLKKRPQQYLTKAMGFYRAEKACSAISVLYAELHYISTQVSYPEYCCSSRFGLEYWPRLLSTAGYSHIWHCLTCSYHPHRRCWSESHRPRNIFYRKQHLGLSLPDRNTPFPSQHRGNWYRKSCVIFILNSGLSPNLPVLLGRSGPCPALQSKRPMVSLRDVHLCWERDPSIKPLVDSEW